jgi:hypothetical protein
MALTPPDPSRGHQPPGAKTPARQDPSVAAPGYAAVARTGESVARPEVPPSPGTGATSWPESTAHAEFDYEPPDSWT